MCTCAAHILRSKARRRAASRSCTDHILMNTYREGTDTPYIRTSFHIIIHHICSGALQTAQLSGFSDKISEIISKIISDCRYRLPIEQSHFVLVIFHEHIGFALISFAVAWITKCTSSFGYLAFLALSMGVSGLITSFISSSCGPLIDFSCSSQEKVP